MKMGGDPGLGECLEHATMKCEAIQKAKTAHQMLWQTLETFHVRRETTAMLQNIAGLSLQSTTSMFTIGWIHLQVSIAKVCRISPILFSLLSRLTKQAVLLE